MTKSEAQQALIDGKLITHQYYKNDEFLYLDGNIRNESNYNMGTFMDEFWMNIQKLEDGWSKRTGSPLPYNMKRNKLRRYGASMKPDPSIHVGKEKPIDESVKFLNNGDPEPPRYDRPDGDTAEWFVW